MRTRLSLAFWLAGAALQQGGPALAGEIVQVPVTGGELAKQCGQAYRQEDLPFLIKHCPEEAWALARAQCEQDHYKVKPRFVEYCNLFYTGQAPSYGTP